MPPKPTNANIDNEDDDEEEDDDDEEEEEQEQRDDTAGRGKASEQLQAVSSDEVRMRLVTWNLEGSNNLPHVKDLLAISFPNEQTHIHAFCLQEVRCLEQLRDGIWEAIGGRAKFELFEHWMGRSGPGFPGQTALLVFVPKPLCVSGRFRLSRLANAEIKREVMRGTKFRFGRSDKGGGMTSSRGAVSMPFSFLDTTFTLVSVRLHGDDSEKFLESQNKDLENVLELCRLNEQEDGAMGSILGTIHHTFFCGSFMEEPKRSADRQSNGGGGGATSSTQPLQQGRKTIAQRLSFVRRSPSVKSAGSTSTSNNNNNNNNSNFDLLAIRNRFPALQVFRELEENEFAFNADHIFFRCASKRLETLLTAESNVLLSAVQLGRTPLSTLFRLRGRGSEILSSWSRVTGNVPLHLSSRSNMVHVKKDPPQRPRLSSAVELRKERAARSSRAHSSHSTGGGTRSSVVTPAPSLVPLPEDSYLLECTRCEAPISNDEAVVPVTSDGNAYHLRCFCCDHCGVPLRNTAASSLAEVSFHEVDGRLLCNKSFETLFVNICEECGGALGQEFLTIPAGGEDKRYHISCFHCAECLRPFATKLVLGDIVIEAAVPHEGLYLCEADFKRVVGGVKCSVCEHSFDRCIRVNGGEAFCSRDFAETFSGGMCFFCNKQVTEDSDAIIVKSQDKPGSNKGRRAAHVECLKCSACGKSLQETGSSFVEFEGKHYCELDWDRVSSQQTHVICGKCKLPIAPGSELFSAIGQQFHPQCFACTFCGCNLVDAKEFFEHDNLPWCELDYERFCRTDLPACQACHRVVGSKDKNLAKTLNGMTWHKQCYVCTSCGTSLANCKQPRVVAPRGKIYCDKC